LIFIKKKKKSNQTEIFLKKPKQVQTDQFRFGFLGQKPVQTDQFRFGFLGQKPVQPGLARFFLVFSVSVWFFRFRTYKTETEQVSFFKILIGFFMV
jgi:hypothetical protein